MHDQSLKQHLFMLHGVSQSITHDAATCSTGPAVTYVVHYFLGGQCIPCPVTGCPAIPVNWECMRDHFIHWHPNDIIYDSSEGILLQCTHCGKFLHSVNDAHLASRACHQLAARRQAWAEADANRLLAKTSFHIGSTKIETVPMFKYLGWFLSNDDCDDLAIQVNLKKARN